uniref:Uncharacterized protein n=1 Tax=Lygus hesperus TaxID=30085 RepID=A0A0A9YY93_LYGHE
MLSSLFHLTGNTNIASNAFVNTNNHYHIHQHPHSASSQTNTNNNNASAHAVAVSDEDVQKLQSPCARRNLMQTFVNAAEVSLSSVSSGTNGSGSSSSTTNNCVMQLSKAGSIL